jgi:hypothetical protein
MQKLVDTFAYDSSKLTCLGKIAKSSFPSESLMTLTILLFTKLKGEPFASSKHSLATLTLSSLLNKFTLDKSKSFLLN